MKQWALLYLNKPDLFNMKNINKKHTHGTSTEHREEIWREKRKRKREFQS